MDIWSEKNKATSSQHEISVVFDKRCGIDKFWSEFYFISTYTPSEMKLIRGNVDPFLPLCIKTEGAYSKLEIINPETGEVQYTSKGFYKKNAKKLYFEDEEFRRWFDIAVDISCRERISKGLLKINMDRFDHSGEVVVEDNIIAYVDNDVVEDVPVEPKKRGRKKKVDGFALSGNDIELTEMEILQE